MIKKVEDNFLKKLFSASGVVITPHVAPDGDAVGSTVSLSFMLTLKNIPNIILMDSKPDYYKDLLRINSCIDKEIPLKIEETLIKSEIDSLGDNPLHVYVDCAEKSRITSSLDVIKKAGVFNYSNTLAIDHHERPDDFVLSYIDESSPSCGDLMFNIMTSTFKQSEIPSELATAIYYAIASDTDNFRHLTNNNSDTFERARVLTELGANPSLVYNARHGGRPLENVEYMARILSNLVVIKDKNVIVALDDKDMFSKLGREARPSKSIYDTLLEVKDVEMIAFLKYREVEGEIEGSLRVSPKSTYQAHEICRILASGGGHEKAAGFTYHGSMDEALSAFTELINSNLEELKK